MEGLRTDQAPPLAIPAAFFLTAPAAMFVCGVMIAWAGPGMFASRWHPLSLAATHLVTLGYLGSIMLGALFQMAPVVAGVPVPGARYAHAILGAWGLGVTALVAGLATGHPLLLQAAPTLLGVAILTFVGAMTAALARAPAKTRTVSAMRLALVGMVVVATIGVLLVLRRAGVVSPLPDAASATTAHAASGALGWVGLLLVGVSWQVIPMFYLAPALPRWSEAPTLAAGSLLTFGLPLAVAGGGGPWTIAALAAPAAIAIWGVHPVMAVRAILRRRRRRADFSLRFWLGGLACGALTLALAVGAALGDDPRWAVALGWTAGWGWAGLITHGMLSRIVPFLVWFHRFSPLVGRVPTPSMRELLPEPRLRVALVLHIAAVVTGLVAIGTGRDALARLAGALLAATAVVLGANLVGVVRRRPAG